MILLLDNYDSFTYNLQDYFAQLDASCTVFRNDELTLAEFISLKPEAIVFSPGPETPSKAGRMMDLISQFHDKIPLLGICLGHQAIGEFFGASLSRAIRPMHGKTSVIHHNHPQLFNGFDSAFQAMRYHSLVLKDLNATALQVIAHTNEEEVMAITHPAYKICGMQFHPESILTPGGIRLLNNWLKWSSLK